MPNSNFMQIKKILLLLLILTVFSCKNKKQTEALQIVREWTGKEILIPDDVQCAVMGKDTTSSVCRTLMDAEYKVLLYVDSTGCSSCRLKLFLWETLISEADSLFQKKLSFLFFFQPKNRREFDFLFRKEQFNHPVFLDMNNSINRLNHFPPKTEYQCFLLDKNNKVQMIGNPSLSPQIWKLYKQVISGQTQEQEHRTPVTNVSVSSTEIKLNDLQKNKKSVATFTLKNIGNQPLSINSIDASCGCTKPVWDKSPVAPGKETSVTLEIQPEDAGFFHKTVQVYCNTEKGVITLVISGEVK
jgi:hypothetical protein